MKMNQRFIYQIVLPLCTLIFVCLIIGLKGHLLLAQLLSWGGTMVILSYNVCWIVFADSKRRWPNRSAFERFARLMTFYR